MEKDFSKYVLLDDRYWKDIPNKTHLRIKRKDQDNFTVNGFVISKFKKGGEDYILLSSGFNGEGQKFSIKFSTIDRIAKRIFTPVQVEILMLVNKMTILENRINVLEGR